MNKIINKIGNKISEMGNKINERFEPQTITIQKYKPFFYTTDDKKHEGVPCNWCIINRLKHSVPREVMSLIMRDGYIEDKNGVMYLLSNVKNIEWYRVDSKDIEDKFYAYQIFVSDEDIEGNIKDVDKDVDIEIEMDIDMEIETEIEKGTNN